MSGSYCAVSGFGTSSPEEKAAPRVPMRVRLVEIAKRGLRESFRVLLRIHRRRLLAAQLRTDLVARLDCDGGIDE